MFDVLGSFGDVRVVFIDASRALRSPILTHIEALGRRRVVVVAEWTLPVLTAAAAAAWVQGSALSIKLSPPPGLLLALPRSQRRANTALSPACLPVARPASPPPVLQHEPPTASRGS